MSNHTRFTLPSLLVACTLCFLACGPAAAPPSLTGDVGVALRIDGNPLPAEREALAKIVASAGMRSQGGTRFEVVDELRAKVIVDVSTELRTQTEPGGGVVIARELRGDGRVSLAITTDGLVKAGLALDRELRALTDQAVYSMRAEGKTPAVDSMRAEGNAPAEVDSLRTASEPTAVTSMRAEGAPDRDSPGCHRGVCIE